MNEVLKPTLENADTVQKAIELSSIYDDILDVFCDVHNQDCSLCPLEGGCHQIPTKKDILVVLCWLHTTIEDIKILLRLVDEDE